MISDDDKMLIIETLERINDYASDIEDRSMEVLLALAFQTVTFATQVGGTFKHAAARPDREDLFVELMGMYQDTLSEMAERVFQITKIGLRELKNGAD